MKKAYITPTINVVEVLAETNLMEGSFGFGSDNNGEADQTENLSRQHFDVWGYDDEE